MFLKKVLNQPNLVGTVMIVLLFGAGFVYAFAFDGFNVQTATDGEVEAWLAAAGGGGSGSQDCGGKCTVNGQAANCKGSGCTYKCKGTNSPHKLHTKGQTANSTQEIRKVCSNAIHQIREYDANGDALKDTDYHTPHQGAPTPHYHHWVNGRQPWSANP